MKPPLKSLLFVCLVAASAAQSTDKMSSTTTSTTVLQSDATDTTISTVPDATDTTISTTPDATDTTISTVPDATDTTISTTPDATDTTISTTPDITDTTISTVPDATDTTISTTPGITDTTISTVPDATDTTISTVPDATDTTISTMPDTTDTAASTSDPTTRGPCSPNPCVGNGICEERFGGVFACVCRPGLVYDDIRGCYTAKVFPGDLSLKDTFHESMSQSTSALFKEIADQIQKQLKNTLTGDGYINSVVLSLKPGSIIARVQNFYELSSSATNQSVGSLIAKAIAAGSITNASGYTRLSVCDIGFCDSDTTSCKGETTAVCTCKYGYIKSNFTDQTCIACRNGEKAVDGLCKKCTFGFSGFNCGDPYLLVVVVVSCGLGALLIVFIVALIIVSCSKQNKNSLSKEDFSPYGNVEMHKPAGVPRIPRANPNSDWQTENLEVTNSGSTQSLVTKNQQDNKTRYTNYNNNDDMRYRSYDPSERGAQNPYFRQDSDSMRRY